MTLVPIFHFTFSFFLTFICHQSLSHILYQIMFMANTRIHIAVTALILCNVSHTNAFISNQCKSHSISSTFSQLRDTSVNTTNPKEEKKKDMSIAIPFLERPVILNGELPGDVGFDPLGFATGKNELLNYREAEIKHSRLAMLAAAGWLLSEVFEKQILPMFGVPSLLDDEDRVPSLLNGGLDKVSPWYWISCIVVAAFIDINGMRREVFEAEGYFPGNLGWDPIGFYPKDAASQKEMQTKEIKHGRLAMVAVVIFAIQEFIFKEGEVDIIAEEFFNG